MSIYKSEDRKKCENYRPISILPIVSKIFERSVFNQLYEFLNANSLLSKSISVFRNFSKEALNIGVLIFGITFRLKLSKLNQFIYLKIV